MRGVRLLTAEQSTDHGRPVVLGAHWYDSDEVEARQQAHEEEMQEYEKDL